MCDGCARHSPQRPGAAVERTAGPPRVQLSVTPGTGNPSSVPFGMCSPQGHATDEQMLVARATSG
jgi:hypothetical protein